MTTAQRFRELEAAAIIMVDLKPDPFAEKNSMFLRWRIVRETVS